LVHSLTKNPEEEDPLQRISTKCFDWGVLFLRVLGLRTCHIGNPPRGGGLSAIKVSKVSVEDEKTSCERLLFVFYRDFVLHRDFFVRDFFLSSTETNSKFKIIIGVVEDGKKSLTKKRKSLSRPP